MTVNPQIGSLTRPYRTGAAGDDESRSGAEREALLRVAATAAGANDLESVLELAAEEALRAIGAASLTVSRFEQDRTRYRTLINVGELSEWEERRPVDESYEVSRFPRLVDMAQTAQPYFDALDDPDCDPAAAAFLRSVGKSSDLGVAIVVEGEIWGGVWATTTTASPPFRSEDVRFLEAIGGQLATAIARAELFARVSRFAYEDALTGLANRRAFEERLDRAVARREGGNTTLALLLADVDELKAVNDTRGHAAGDAALRSVAEALVAAAAEHPGTFVARLGGDEFCVLLESLEDVPRGEELGTIEQLGSTVQQLLSQRGTDLTLSCGAATASERLHTGELLLRAADTAQYVAKRRGGARICTAAQIADAPDRFPTSQPSVDMGAERLAAAAVAVAQTLADDLAQAPILDRLEHVATTFAEACDFARWAVSIAASGADHLRDLSLGDNRDRRGAGVRVVRAERDPELYDLDEFPATARVVARGSGSFVARVDDPSTDDAERALLEREGFAGVVGAAAGHADGVYTVELVSDDPCTPLDAVEPLLALAVGAAMPTQPHRRFGEGSANRNRARELSLALAHRLAGATAQHEVYKATVEEVEKAFGCSIVQIVEIVGERLEMRAEHSARATAEGWSQGASTGLIGRCLRERTPVLADDVRREPQFRSPEAHRGVRSELAVAIVVDDELWGALNLEDAAVAAFSSDDARLLESVAAQVGGALTAIRLYERLDRAYVGTAEALSAALEAKDSYTARHSRSIARHALAVGALLGLGSEELRMLRYAAAFHDIGKLAIPREILNKPGPLDPDEWAQMTQHTIIGERILTPIEFLAPVRPLVRSAHERWDGGGYPDGLSGKEIPLGARILFACDAYDAMTTDRTYRSAMSPAEAREELLSGAGSQFDPRVVDALMSVVATNRASAPVAGDLATASGSRGPN